MHTHELTSAWTQSGRGFWTKRKRTATSLVSVVALLAGMAVAFKLFDQIVPNNVVRDASVFAYEVQVLGETGYATADGANPIFQAGDDIFPGETLTRDVKIINTQDNPARDASFSVYITDILVFRCPDFGTTAISDDFNADGSCAGGAPVEVTTGLDRDRFINLFTFTADKQQVASTPLGERRLDAYQEACTGGLRSFLPNAPCELGRVRAKGTISPSSSAPTATQQPMDEREYLFKISELDDASDQSRFRGWYVDIDFVFAARVPALAG